MRSIIFFVAIFCASPVFAVGPNWDLAHNLGLILASEELCGLKFEKKGIENFIVNRVGADDLDFANELSGGLASGKFKVSRMTPSELTAHCTQIQRVAKTYGFLN